MTWLCLDSSTFTIRLFVTLQCRGMVQQCGVFTKDFAFMALCQVGGYLSHVMDPDKPNGMHFMPAGQRDSMLDAYHPTKGGKAGFGVQKRIPGKNNDEWYLLEAMHSLKASVQVSGEDNDERYELKVMYPLNTEAWCGDTETKICSQFTQDSISMTFSSCTIYLTKWCKEANSAKSK
jgi:hypothetical protein